jgi:hypothetical protein
MSDLQEEDEEVLAVVTASAPRRVLGIGALWALALLLIYIAVFERPALGWQVFLITLSAASLWVAEQMRRATGERLELTRQVLRPNKGVALAQVADIISLDRGAFAFKPSNGFLLKLSQAAPGAWHPGLWWRTGRRVGVGGMTPGHQTKFMAEMISAMIAQRKMSDPD